MQRDVTPIQSALRAFTVPLKYKLQQSWKKHWFKIGILIFAGFILSQKDFSFNFRLNANTPQLTVSDATTIEPQAMNTSIIEGGNRKPVSYENHSPEPATIGTKPEANKPVIRENVSPRSVDTEKVRRQKAYVKRFVKVAQAEMEKFGIPASITLAQGLLESQAGKSRLATENRNHFGIKCFSKRCHKGHCSNFTDDSHKDFFRIYKTAWESYRAHSNLLQSTRYKPLYRLSHTDYKGWAHGLKRAGYATDKRYAEKLIKLIEELGLYQYDH